MEITTGTAASALPAAGPASAAAGSVSETAGAAVARDSYADSIFSQLIGRIIRGRRINLGDGADSANSLEILLENCADPVLLLTVEGQITEANPAFCADYGYARADLLGTSVYTLLPKSDRAALGQRLARFGLDEGGAAGDDLLTFRGIKRSGATLTRPCLVSSLHDGKRKRIMALFRDAFQGEGNRVGAELSDEHYMLLAESVPEAIFRLDEDFTILFVNAGAKSAFGYEKEELVGQSFVKLFPEEVFRRHEADFRKYFYVDESDRPSLGLRRTIELLGITKNRGMSLMEMSFGNSKEFAGRTLTCIVRDISQRKTMERRLRHLEFHDKLTGLGNRDLFNEDIKDLLSTLRDAGERKAALVFMDITDFKHVNDTIGHDAGDGLLAETARRIRLSLRETDLAYRFAGDKFIALLPEVKETADTSIVAERILESVREPHELSLRSGERRRIELGMSIGLAVLPDHGLTPESATKSADIAMYCAKEAGRNRFVMFDESLRPKSTEKWLIEQEMRNGLVKGEFALYYQAIVDPSGKVLGFEALTRWVRGGETVMPSQDLILFAEENGMILTLGAWVLWKALNDRARLQGKVSTDCFFSVNVSTRQFEQPDFVQELSDAIESVGLDAGLLNLELTETTLMRHPDDAIAKINAIKSRYPKMRFSIDDFGTGYSSLSYLARLPVDSVKVDISFVRALADEQNRKVVSAILSLADNLGMHVIAEGIDTQEQYRYFKDRDCYGMQGYLFMKPVPLEDIEGRFFSKKARGRERA